MPPNLVLIEPTQRSDRRPDISEAVGAVARWQTKAAIQAAMCDAGCENPHQLERLLDLRNASGERPRLLSRMRYLGEPAVPKFLGPQPYGNPHTSAHIKTLCDNFPVFAEVACEPTWRLLDPRPFDNLEFSELNEEILTKYWNRDRIHELRGKRVIKHPRASYTYLRYSRDDRLSLMSAFVSLRLAEKRADLVAYFLALLSVLDRSEVMNPLPSLKLFLPDLKDYVVTHFGGVEISSSCYVEYLQEELAIARNLYETARREFDETPEPTKTWSHAEIFRVDLPRPRRDIRQLPGSLQPGRHRMPAA